jgi:hypothetical protein
MSQSLKSIHRRSTIAHATRYVPGSGLLPTGEGRRNLLSRLRHSGRSRAVPRGVVYKYIDANKTNLCGGSRGLNEGGAGTCLGHDALGFKRTYPRRLREESKERALHLRSRAMTAICAHRTAGVDVKPRSTVSGRRGPGEAAVTFESSGRGWRARPGPTYFAPPKPRRIGGMLGERTRRPPA